MSRYGKTWGRAFNYALGVALGTCSSSRSETFWQAVMVVGAVWILCGLIGSALDWLSQFRVTRKETA